MKKIILFFLLLFSCIVYSQTTKLSNTLLWRISGNGLSKPSYLYGTMHLTDKRVFQLGDSLYSGIEHVDGFAGELDMNIAGMQLLNYIIADKEAKAAREAVKVKDAVSPEIWEKYKSQLQEKFYKSPDKITVDDLEGIGSSLETDLFRTGDMPTFLDAYLFGLARKQGKWVGGLEVIEEQLEHINSETVEHKIQTALFDDKYYRSGVESLIKLYVAQKLDSIDTYMYREENGAKDLIMIKRNLKMVRMMDSLSFVRSTFFAVGAAHLPGDSGVIALLQKKGFTVSPVISSKKISPDKYILKAKEFAWTPVHVKDSIYNIEMPGVSESFGMLESLGLDMKMFFDISFMKVYMTVGIELSESRKKYGADSLYSSMKDRFFATSTNIKEKHISVNGIEGREYTGSTLEGEIKMQVFLPSMEAVVLNGIFSLSKKNMDNEETLRFFQSFSYNGLSKKPVETEKSWSSLSYPSLLFSIDMPSKPKETKDVKSREGVILNSYQSVDVKNQVFYGLTVSSVKEGVYHTNSDTTYFTSIKYGLKSSIDNFKVIDSAYTSFSGFPAYRLMFTGKSGGESIEAKILSVTRGKRNYYLFSVYAPGIENTTAADRFIKSFTLLKPLAEWKMITSPDSSFVTSSNVAMKKSKPDEDDQHWDAERFVLYDSITASTTIIDRTILPSWLWYSSDTAFLRERAGWYRQYYNDDSIAGYTVSTINNRVIADFTVIAPGTRPVKRVKLILNGNELYEIYGHYHPADLKDSYSRVFDQFVVKRNAIAVERSGSNLKTLARVVENGTSDDAKRATWWWNSLPMSADDLPTLQSMILTLYPDFDSVNHNCLNERLIDKVKELDTLHTTIEFLKKSYAAGEIKNEYIKPLVADYLLNVRTTESYLLLKNILNDKSPKTKSSFYSFYLLYDSLKLAATLYPALLKYADDEVMANDVHRLTIDLLDSGLINKKIIVDNGKPIINYAKEKLNNDRESIESTPVRYYDCIRLLGIMNTPESNGLLARFAKFDNRGIRFHTLIAQMANNQPVDSRTLYTLATTDEYRHDLYTELKRIGKQSQFPASFLSQEQMGKSKLYDFASNKPNPPFFMEFVTARVVSFKGKQQKFLLYKVNPADIGDPYYLGVAGPYSLNSKEYVSSHEATGIYRKKEYDAKELDNFLKDYLWSVENKDEEEEIEPPPPPPPPIRN